MSELPTASSAPPLLGQLPAQLLEWAAEVGGNAPECVHDVNVALGRLFVARPDAAQLRIGDMAEPVQVAGTTAGVEQIGQAEKIPPSAAPAGSLRAELWARAAAGTVADPLAPSPSETVSTEQPKLSGMLLVTTPETAAQRRLRGEGEIRFTSREQLVLDFLEENTGSLVERSKLRALFPEATTSAVDQLLSVCMGKMRQHPDYKDRISIAGPTYNRTWSFRVHESDDATTPPVETTTSGTGTNDVVKGSSPSKIRSAFTDREQAVVDYLEEHVGEEHARSKLNALFPGLEQGVVRQIFTKVGKKLRTHPDYKDRFITQGTTGDRTWTLIPQGTVRSEADVPKPVLASITTPPKQTRSIAKIEGRQDGLPITYDAEERAVVGRMIDSAGADIPRSLLLGLLSGDPETKGRKMAALFHKLRDDPRYEPLFRTPASPDRPWRMNRAVSATGRIMPIPRPAAESTPSSRPVVPPAATAQPHPVVSTPQPVNLPSVDVPKAPRVVPLPASDTHPKPTPRPAVSLPSSVVPRPVLQAVPERPPTVIVQPSPVESADPEGLRPRKLTDWDLHILETDEGEARFLVAKDRRINNLSAIGIEVVKTLVEFGEDGLTHWELCDEVSSRMKKKIEPAVVKSALDRVMAAFRMLGFYQQVRFEKIRPRSSLPRNAYVISGGIDQDQATA